MYAVIETGGKQYRVELGAEIQVDRLDAEAGSSIELGRVLLVADGDDTSIGQPLVDGAMVVADVVRQDRGDKIVVFKYKPKARRRVKKGHRQDLTVLRIADIRLGSRSAAKDAQRQEAEDRKAREAAEAEAAKRAKADQELAAKLEAEAAAAEEPAASGRPSSRKRTKAAGASEASDSDATPDAPADEAATDEAAADETTDNPKPATRTRRTRSTTKDE